MKLDLDYIRKVASNLHQLYRESGGYQPDAHVYSVHFEPDSNYVRCHISWPYFRNLVANEADGPCEVCKAGTGLHLTASVQGVEMITCVFKYELVDMLKDLGYEVSQDTDVLVLFTLWQNASGWNVEVNE